MGARRSSSRGRSGWSGPGPAASRPARPPSAGGRCSPPGAPSTIPIVANRRMNGPVSFDLQVLAGEALLTLEDGGPGLAPGRGAVTGPRP